MSSKLGLKARRAISVLIVVAIIIAVFAVGSFVSNLLLDRQIKSLSKQRDVLSARAAELKAEIDLTDAQSASDSDFLNRMFGEIFTFSNIDEFDSARISAQEYNLPSVFINRFYDKTELSSGYADAMLDILCRYDSCKLYLLERSDGVGYYVADIKLNLVKYTGSIRMAAFIALAENGSQSERVLSMTYYYID